MDDSNILEALLAVAGILLIILIPIIVFMVIVKWKMFKKAGKQGWEAIIPIYSDWILVEIAGLNWWWFLLLIAGNISISYTTGDGNSFGYIISLASLFGSFVVNYNIAKKVHKDVGFAVLLTLLPLIGYAIIAFSSNYQFDHSVEVSKNGPFGGDTSTGNSTNNSNNVNNAENNSDIAYCSNCGAKVDKDTKFCGNCGKEI